MMRLYTTRSMTVKSQKMRQRASGFSTMKGNTALLAA